MGKKKTTQTQNSTQTNTFGSWTPPETDDIKRGREIRAALDPTISFNFSRRREDFANLYNNPMSAFTTPHVPARAIRADNERLAQEESVAMQDVDNTNYVRQMALAELTRPRFVQTGGTSSGTTVTT